MNKNKINQYLVSVLKPEENLLQCTLKLSKVLIFWNQNLHKHYSNFETMPRGSLHESGLSFNPERHFEFSPCLFERLDWGLKDRGKSKSYSGLKIIPDLCTDFLIVSANLALIHLSTWSSIFAKKSSFRP